MPKDLNYYFDQFSQNKSQRIFKKVYENSKLQLFGIIHRILKERTMSEDCLQEVYIKIWRRVDSYDKDKAKALTWMGTIARNHAIDTIRKRNLPIVDDFEMSSISDEALDFYQNISNREQNQKLQHCLKILKPQVMEVLVLAYFSGMTYDDIAKTQKAPTNTIKTWVRRALPQLKKCLEDEDEK